MFCCFVTWLASWLNQGELVVGGALRFFRILAGSGFKALQNVQDKFMKVQLGGLALADAIQDFEVFSLEHYAIGGATKKIIQVWAQSDQVPFFRIEHPNNIEIDAHLLKWDAFDQRLSF